MPEPDRKPANELRRLLEPHAHDGNSLAAAYIARLDAAEDPDAEAAAIVRQIEEFVRIVAKIGRDLSRAVLATLRQLAAEVNRTQIDVTVHSKATPSDLNRAAEQAAAQMTRDIQRRRR